MPWGLKRYYGAGHLHFITCSCHQRQPLLGSPERRDLFLRVLEQVRQRYQFVVVGYVVMPEHFHLLISEPQDDTPSLVMQALKLRFARRVQCGQQREIRERLGDQREVPRSRTPRDLGHPIPGRPDSLHPDAGHVHDSHHIWQPRFYDFNVWSPRKRVEKLCYIHDNPVKRGLVESLEQWRWSSYRTYALGERGTVRINQWDVLKLKVRPPAA